MHNNSSWEIATVTAVIPETPIVKTVRLALPHIVEHLAGQHYEVRLTAPDGYQAARLYSAASAATGDSTLELTIAETPDGEVSPYLFGGLKPGDQLEVRGPLGKFFTWEPTSTEPVFLIGGGSGVVPMRSILQAHTFVRHPSMLHILYSARSAENIIYKSELLDNPQVTITLSDTVPAGWKGHTGRITLPLIEQTLATFPIMPVCYVCGLNVFVEAMAQMLIEAGVPATRIKAERFGS